MKENCCTECNQFAFQKCDGDQLSSNLVKLVGVLVGPRVVTGMSRGPPPIHGGYLGAHGARWTCIACRVSIGNRPTGWTHVRKTEHSCVRGDAWVSQSHAMWHLT